jgi:hypothetical protein
MINGAFLTGANIDYQEYVGYKYNHCESEDEMIS